MSKASKASSRLKASRAEQGTKDIASSRTSTNEKGLKRASDNVRADTAARLGRDSHVSCHPDSPETPKSVLHHKVDLATTDMWKKVWRREPGCSQTRLWFPEGPRRDFSFDVIRLPKVICSQITQFVTGHCFLNRHQALIENEERAKYIMSLPVDEREEGEEIIPISPALCRRCGEEEEKPHHLMSVCPKLATLRLRIFAHPFPQPPYTNFKLRCAF